MKFTQENLDKYNLRYIPDKNHWLGERGRIYYLKESCKGCSDSFLGRKENQYCTKSCLMQDSNSPQNISINSYEATRKRMLSYQSEERKKKLSEANKGRKKSKAEREKLSKTGKELWQNPEYRQRMSEAHKGKIAWNKGRPWNSEMKKKLSEAHKGYEIPMETRIKLSISLKKHFAKNKNSIDNLSGENSRFWQGGISREPYPFEFDNKLRGKIKKRDGYKCQNPDCEGKKARLCIHHINYIKQDFRDENLITLCNYCNVKANFNREYWQDYYEEILSWT